MIHHLESIFMSVISTLILWGYVCSWHVPQHTILSITERMMALPSCQPTVIRFGRNPFLTKYNTDTMFHCVWGGGKAYNGYFAFFNDEEFSFDPILNDTGSKLPLENTEGGIQDFYTFKPNDL